MCVIVLGICFAMEDLTIHTIPPRIPRSAPNGEALEEVVLVSFVDLREAFIAIPARPVECHGCHTMILLEALQIYP